MPETIREHLNELKQLEDGWLDGNGLAPTAEGLDWLTTVLEDRRLAGTAFPYLYPTEDGGVLAEYHMDKYGAELEVDPTTHKATWFQDGTETDEDKYIENIDMDADGFIPWLKSKLTEGGVK